MSLRVVVAPDSFKGTATATAAATAIAAGWLSVRDGDRLILLPQADGGEGTMDAVAAALPTARRHTVTGLTGPDGTAVDADWLELPDGTAVVDLASVCGLPLMAVPDALGASTRGLGELIAAAVAAGATSLIIGLGGSATTDGGAGALSALGLVLIDDSGSVVGDGGGALSSLARIDRSSLLRPPAGGVIVLSDVTAPLLGPLGAAAIFGPQKGASPADIRRLDRGLALFAELLGGDPDLPGAGAAGGTALGFSAAWGAEIRSGAETIARLTGLKDAIARADIVITGEGRFDAQSLMGKSVGHTLKLAADRATPGVHPGLPPQSWVIAGVIDESIGGAVADSIGVEDPPHTLSLSEIAGSQAAASADPLRWLHRAGSLAASAVTP